MEAALEGRRTDRLHDRFADDFADRGADSAALHGGYRRAAVPRICRHAERDDFRFRRRFADADADDVLAASAAHSGIAAEPLLPQIRETFSNGSSRSMGARCTGFCSIRRAHCSLLRERSCSPFFFTSSCRKDFSRFRIRASFRVFRAGSADPISFTAMSQ